MIVTVTSTRLLSLVLLASAVYGKVYQSIGEFNAADTRPFDFIIGGGGNAGCVLASRLSEYPGFNVLLIEAGQDSLGVETIQIPGFGQQINMTEFNWNFTTVPGKGLLDRTYSLPRGRGLGGSTLINGMAYTRGALDDYNGWAKVTGDRGWSWDALQPYIKKHEKWVPPAGGRDPTGQWDPRYHGFAGNVQVSLPWDDPYPIDLRSVENAKLQPQFPMVDDINSGRPVGVGWSQSGIGNGERSSAAKSYLGPQVRERPNLSILLNTHVTRVLPSGSKVNGLVPLKTIEFAPRNGGARSTLTARKEVIISGGAISTPQILLNSGLGNATELTALQIPVIIDSPHVGQGLVDHPGFNVMWTSPPLETPPITQDQALAMWRENRTGPLTGLFRQHQILFLRIPKDSELWKTYDDPAPGPTTPHLEMPLSPSSGSRLVLVTPHSRGWVRLRTANPFDKPLIDLGFLTHPFDLAALKAGVRIVKQFFSGPAWDGYVLGFQGPDPDALSDEAFELAVRRGTSSFAHPVGTAKMGRRSGGTSEAVVGPDLVVKGARGLRVVDASVFPIIPSAHTQAPVYILAERAADLIRKAWL